MRWPIRLQIFLPFAMLLALAVIGGAVWSSQLAARRAGAIELQRLSRVVDSLAAADFPYSAAVLQRMHGLSGAEFISVDQTGVPLATTLEDVARLPPLEEIPLLDPVTTSLDSFPQITLANETYFVSAVETRHPALEQRLFILYPRQTWERLRGDAAWPPLAIGGLTLLLMLFVSGWLAHRIGSRIDTVRQLFRELEQGRYPRLASTELRDELGDLVTSANQLSVRLELLQGEIARTEQLRILAQVAGGFAHQLRNSITGARMAVQLHQRACATPQDEALEVALSQLALTEQQVRGLLALSSDSHRLPLAGDLFDCLQEVERLVRPQAEHLQIKLLLDQHLAEPVVVQDRDLIRGASMNLVLNALEAAGVGGTVRVSCESNGKRVAVRVFDSGCGPSAGIRDRMFEAFATSKPEGVGLGLMLASQAATSQGGELHWTRHSSTTEFWLEWPIAGPAPLATAAPLASLASCRETTDTARSSLPPDVSPSSLTPCQTTDRSQSVCPMC